MPASTILLIEADPAFAESISSGLTKVGYTVTVVADPTDALGRVTDHQLVIIDVVTGPKSAIDICREIRATPSMASIPVLCVSQSDDVEDVSADRLQHDRALERTDNPRVLLRGDMQVVQDGRSDRPDPGEFAGSR